MNPALPVTRIFTVRSTAAQQSRSTFFDDAKEFLGIVGARLSNVLQRLREHGKNESDGQAGHQSDHGPTDSSASVRPQRNARTLKHGDHWCVAYFANACFIATL